MKNKNNFLGAVLLIVLVTVFTVSLVLMGDVIRTLQTSEVQLKRDLQIQSNITTEALKQVNRLDRELKSKEQRLKGYEAELRKIRSNQIVLSRGGRPVRQFEATWYNYNSGRTATGVPPRDGRTVAVDPKVIPLGSWLAIKFPDGKTYIRKAEDTGGAVDGKVLDMYSTAPTEELYRRGRTRGVEVQILRLGGN